MAPRPETHAEERAFLADFRSLLGNQALAAVDSIDDRLGLDYFGIDCSPQDDGSLVLFETNACVNVFYPNQKPFEYANTQVETIRAALNKLILQRANVRAAR